MQQQIAFIRRFIAIREFIEREDISQIWERHHLSDKIHRQENLAS